VADGAEGDAWRSEERGLGEAEAAADGVKGGSRSGGGWSGGRRPERRQVEANAAAAGAEGGAGRG
jgi:hypothetical protein